jgi:VanZ family protein
MASTSIVYGSYLPRSSGGGRERRRIFLRRWLPVMAGLMIFAFESTSYCGAEHTDAPLRRVAEALCGYDIGVHWRLIHHLIRKTGHFMGYGGFCLVVLRACWQAFSSAASPMMRQLRAHGLAILTTFLVAGADEYHQSFLPNRWGSFSDVLLDTSGGVALCFALFLVIQAVKGRGRTNTLCRSDAAGVEAA